ncbi:MAG: CvpA family protein [Planctomycetota bacterium]
MVAIDIACAVVVVLFTIFGALRGFIDQVFGLLALVAAALFAVPAGVALSEPFIKASETGPYEQARLKMILALVCVLVIFVLVKLVGLVLDKRLGKRRVSEPEEEGAEETRKMRGWNRYWGAVTGATKAVLVCWLVLCFFAAFRSIAPGATAAVDTSWAGGTTRLFNPFDRIAPPDLERAVLALWELNENHPAAFHQVMQKESIRRVREHEALRDLLDERRGDVIGALRDPDFRQTLQQIDWAEVARVAEQALARSRRRESREPSGDEEPATPQQGEPEPTPAD